LYSAEVLILGRYTVVILRFVGIATVVMMLSIYVITNIVGKVIKKIFKLVSCYTFSWRIISNSFIERGILFISSIKIALVCKHNFECSLRKERIE
jgi:hypothetical protein